MKTVQAPALVEAFIKKFWDFRERLFIGKKSLKENAQLIDFFKWTFISRKVQNIKLKYREIFLEMNLSLNFPFSTFQALLTWEIEIQLKKHQRHPQGRKSKRWTALKGKTFSNQNKCKSESFAKIIFSFRLNRWSNICDGNGNKDSSIDGKKREKTAKRPSAPFNSATMRKSFSDA